MDRHRRQRSQLLRPDLAAQRLTVGRAAPPRDLAWSVDYAWWAVWDVPEPHVQQVVPRPVVHVAAETWEDEPTLLVTGPPTEIFERTLQHRGRTVAVAFRPGGFRPFVDRPAGELVDLTVPLATLTGRPDRDLAAQLLDPTLDVEEAGRRLLDWLAGFGIVPDPLVDELASLVEAVERDTTIVRAEQLADLAGVSLRSLQRRFREYVGPGPKWVVQRYRLLDVAEAANRGGDVDWAALAAQLGYSDQSHLIRHFRAVVGEPPGRYADRLGDR